MTHHPETGRFGESDDFREAHDFREASTAIEVWRTLGEFRLAWTPEEIPSYE